tara:strand:- start:15267 stop:15425 length:159 start_codon:yes stop_codon:yes gene_type:complete
VKRYSSDYTEGAALWESNPMPGIFFSEYSLVVKPQPSKLMMGVRFRLLAVCY